MIGIIVGKALVGVFAVLASLRYGAGLLAWRAAEVLEKPSYSVIVKLSGGVELRQYDSYLIAETTLNSGGFSAGDGFRTCAGYIFGKNKPRRSSVEGEKMAMTAPVRVSGSSASTGEKMAMTAPVRIGNNERKQDKTKVSFVIGSQYSLASVPKPIDRSVTVKEVKPHVLAVRTFSGPPPTEERVTKERQKIELALEKANIKSKSNTETMVYGYHDPFLTPNLLRKNEVAVMVDPYSIFF